MDEFYKEKRNRCRFSHMNFAGFGKDISHFCTKNGHKDSEIIKDITKEQCESCEFFKSKFIEYPLTISGIDIDDDLRSLRQSDIGKLATVRPCGEEYNDKTYVGIFLGDLPHAPHISHDERTGKLKIIPMMNPAIFVPELKKIIYGCESWWSLIEKPEDMDREITDELIQSQWYVQLAKAMTGENKEK